MIDQQPGTPASRLKELRDNGKTKILLVGDIHLSDRPPASCTDGYLDDILDMLSYVAKLESALKVDAVVWAGDVFHHKQPSRTSHGTVMKALRVAQEYKNLYIVTGNHDIQSDRLETIREKQPLGVLYESGAATELVGWHPTLPLYGVPWQQRWHHKDTPSEAFETWRARGEKYEAMEERAQKYVERKGMTLATSLAVTHAPIYPPDVADSIVFELVPLAGADGLSEAMGNQGYLYYGHIHDPHGIYEVEGVTYANMGAISRGSLHEYNLARKIQVALWTPEEGFFPVDIPHKPASEIFKLEKATEAKKEKLSLEAFLSDVGNATIEISSTGSIVEHLKGMDIEPPVKKTAIELIEEQE